MAAAAESAANFLNSLTISSPLKNIPSPNSLKLSKIPSNVSQQMQSLPTVPVPSKDTMMLPFALMSAGCRHFLNFLMQMVSTIANSVAILICYVYLKNFKRHSVILVDGYVTIFKTFAEYIGATACLCYGLMEFDAFYFILGLAGIAMGLGLKALLLYRETHSGADGRLLNTAATASSGAYVFVVFVSSCAFHAIAVSVGVLPCATRILTCVLPLVALSESFRQSGGQAGRWFALASDACAVSVLWWHCSQMSLKYFVVVPSIIGLVFSFIQWVLKQIHDVAAKEDLYTN